jgi:hypothetical protein
LNQSLTVDPISDGTVATESKLIALRYEPLTEEEQTNVQNILSSPADGTVIYILI